MSKTEKQQLLVLYRTTEALIIVKYIPKAKICAKHNTFSLNIIIYNEKKAYPTRGKQRQ